MYACMSVRVRVCVRECVCICLYVSVCVRDCENACVHVCSYMCVHACDCACDCWVCMYHSMYVELRGELFWSGFSPTLFLLQCIFQDSGPGVSSWCSYLCLLPLLPSSCGSAGIAGVHIRLLRWALRGGARAQYFYLLSQLLDPVLCTFDLWFLLVFLNS